MSSPCLRHRHEDFFGLDSQKTRKADRLVDAIEKSLRNVLIGNLLRGKLSILHD